MLTQTVTVTKTGVLILARLLAPSSRLNPASLRKDVETFFRGREPGAWHDLLGETLANLKRDGLITLKPLALTETGRARRWSRLGLESMPEKVNWKQIKSKYLVAVALGIPGDDAQQRKQVATADGLRGCHPQGAVSTAKRQDDGPGAGRPCSARHRHERDREVDDARVEGEGSRRIPQIAGKPGPERV